MQSDAIATTDASRQTARLKLAGISAIIVAVLVVITGVVSRIWNSHEAQEWSNGQAVPTVNLVPVRPSAASDGLVLPGTMQAWNAAKLYPRVNGYIKIWMRDIGDHVQAGEALGTIDTPELDQQIGQARADLVSATASAGLARSTAKRWNNLLLTDSVSKQEVDEKNGDLATRTAAVDSAKANLGRLFALKQFSVLRAPFAGTVTLRNADIGDLVGPGTSAQQPVFTVVDMHKIRVYVSVPQTYSAVLKPGLLATLSLPDFPGRSFPATVSGLSSAISAQTGTFQVELIADNPRGELKPGGYAEVSFKVAGRSGTSIVPSSALMFHSRGTFVASATADGHVRMIPIKLGRDFGVSVEVTSDLPPGMTIIDNPPDSLSQGELVHIGKKSHD